MIENKLLIWRFKCGDRAALARIYEKYKTDLLRIATGLSSQVSIAEDIVHDVFVSFAQSSDRLKLSGNLKSYLVTCVVVCGIASEQGSDGRLLILTRLIL